MKHEAEAIMNTYLIRVYGDIADKFIDADGLDMFVMQNTRSLRMFLLGLKNEIDIKDDAVEIYLIDKRLRLKLVWGFWGWHFEPKMDQGYKLVDGEITDLIFSID